MIRFLWDKSNSQLGFDMRASSPWRVWCHFGLDVTLTPGSTVADKWRNYDRLHPAEKGIVEAANSGNLPHHFSKSQNLPWSGHFKDIKSAVAGNRSWGDVAGLLAEAWEMVERHREFVPMLGALSRAHAAVHGARHIRDAADPALADAMKAIRQFVDTCRKSGFTELELQFDSPTHNPSLEALKRCYDAIRHSTVEAAWWAWWWDPPADMSAGSVATTRAHQIRSGLWRARHEIDEFLEKYGELSAGVSTQLRRKP